MADVEVDVSLISSMEKRFEEEIEQLQEDLSSLYTSVEELNQTWEGPNHEEFVKNFENRYLDMTELDRSLKSYLKALKKAQKTYTDCESEVFRIVRNQ